MKYLRYLTILGTILSLNSCSSESEDSLAPETNTDVPICVEASSSEFKTRADESLDNLKEYGFLVWCNYQRQVGETEVNNYFTDYCRFDDAGAWLFNAVEGHSWPDNETKFDFIALSPGALDEDELSYTEDGDLVLTMIEPELGGEFDLMLATSYGVGATTNDRTVSFSFKHLLTMITLNLAFVDAADYRFANYFAGLDLYGDKIEQFNITQNQWIVAESMPEGFTYETRDEYDWASENFGYDWSQSLPATPVGQEWNFQPVFTNYVFPQKYIAVCKIGANNDPGDEPTWVAEGHFDLDLSGMMGTAVTLNVTAFTQSDGKLVLTVTDEEITNID